MTDLKEIVEDIEVFGKMFRKSKDKDARKSYNQYIELIILEAPKTEQYNLCNYWDRLTK